MSVNACFIGLGSMGTPIATNLLKNRVNLFVYNRTQEKTTPLVNQGAKLLSHPSKAFEQSSVVFTMVANDHALKEICEELLKGAKPGCIHVSMSTVSPKLSQELAAKHSEKGVYYLASPVFGRPEAAAQQKLWICLAGNADAKKQVDPLLHFIGQKVYDFGTEPQAANTVKLIGNFMILSVVEMWAETFSLGEKSGVDSKALLEFFTYTIFPSSVYKIYGKLIQERSFEPAGFKMELGLKDIDLLLRAAEAVRVPLPIAGLLHDRLLSGMANNRSEMDWSAISLTMLEEAGLHTNTNKKQ